MNQVNVGPGGRSRSAASLFVLLAVAVAACSSAPSSSRSRGGTGQEAAAGDGRTLVIAIRSEPKALVSSELNVDHTGNTPEAPWQLFHAELTQFDERGTLQLQLAEAFPRLGTDSWNLLPDGRMETTWRIRPDAIWHDGAPLVAEDFVLAIRFIKAVGNTGVTKGVPTIDGATALDSRTLVVHYNAPFPDAGVIAWEPLPRHIIGAAFEQIEDPEVFATLPYWTTEFVGLGPYRLDRWEPGAFITGLAYDRYALGKPKIGRVQVIWVPDANAVVANLLAGTAHFATDLSVGFEHAAVLRREWASKGETGGILLGPAKAVYVQVQYKPEFQRPQALSEPRLRQALAYAIDKQAIVDAVLDGEPGIADTLVPKDVDYYAQLDRALTKFPLDLRRSEQLMAELGYTKDGEGFYGQGGNRLSIQLIPFGDYQREALILVDGWKRAGIDVPLRVLSPAEQMNRQNSQQYPALGIIQAASAAVTTNVYRYFASEAATGTLGGGPNMGGYTDPEIDRLYGVYITSLDRNVRNQAVIDGMKYLSERSTYFPLYYGYELVAHTGNLVGPRAGLKRYALWKIEAWTWADGPR